MHPYSLRTRTSKLETKIVSAAASISDQEASDQNNSSPESRRLFSDVVTGHIALSLRGGHDNTDNISEEDNTFQDLGSIKKSDDLEDLTPDHGLKQWETAHPNVIRRSRSLSSLEDVSKPTKPKAVKPIELGSAVDLVAAAENRLTAEQKLKIERRHGKVARAKKARLPSITSLEQGPSKTKGKGADPSNWGNIHLTEEELDPDAQQAALDSLKPSYYKVPEKTGKKAVI
jgi:hypothetical protein